MPRNNRQRSRLLALTVVALFVASVAGTLAVAFGWFSKETPATKDGVLKAAIVDQLSLYTPNEQFVNETSELLENAGYTVDYVAGHGVTVDLFRELPTKRYDIVIIRGHSGVSRRIDRETGAVSDTEYVSLSTGELYYSYLHEAEQAKGLLGWSVVQEDKPPVFGFGYEFVEREMRGDFGGAQIIMMGCDGLRTRDTAQAFLDRGASAFVSWSQPVSTYQTDRTTQILIAKLLSEGDLDIVTVVEETAMQVGPDPWYGGELRILN